MASADPEDRSDTVFIAIDFGTTKSGFAFAIGTEGPVIIPVTTQGRPCKDDTVIMLNRADYSVYAFGKSALDAFESLDDDEKEKFYVFNRFKMKLFNDEVRRVINWLPSQTATDNA